MVFFKKKPAGPVEWMIVGLGNPDKKYEGTRHNTGFAALEALAEKWGVRVDRVKFRSFYGETSVNGQKIILLKPQTYMNLSGEAVREAMQFFKVPIERVLVFSDDVALPVGKVRVRRNGSAGGQNGLKNIINLCGGEGFPRVRIGVGEKPHPDYDLADWVLSKFTKDEAALMVEACHRAADAAAMIVDGDIDGAMSRYSK